MTESITATSPLTIGIDLGDRKSHICVLDAAGEIAEESQIPTKPKTLRMRFEGLAATRIALEVGGHSAWVSELLGELGHEVIVANARKLRMIFQNDSKSDQLDAEQLARVARLDPKLLYPIVHRNRSARADLAVMRSRDALVATRTRLVNHIHGVLKSFGYRVRKYAAPGFHRQVADQIPEELKPAVQPILETLAAVAQRVLCLDRDLRRLLVQCGQQILGPFGKDSDLRRWGLGLASRGGTAAKKKAVVAVARKLSVLLHRLWITGEVYEPLRNTNRRAAALTPVSAEVTV